MADQGGSQHGIARTSRVRTDEQRARDIDRIRKYRELEDDVRTRIARGDYSTDLFHLTSKLLRLNPEYYTIWNARRRCLISGLFFASPAGCSCSRALPSTSPTGTTPTYSAGCSCSWLAATQQDQECRIAGRSGTTADTDNNTNTNINDDDKTAETANLTLITTELIFTIPLLLDSPKCYWIWSYRLWLLQQAILRLPAPVARKVWEDELKLASKMLAKDRRNFHAWGYRRHVVSQLESEALGGRSMAEEEFAYTQQMIRADLSNFSAWHGRGRLIERLLKERRAGMGERREFLDRELAQIREALNVGPEDQSLWYYHQFLVLNIVYPGKHPAMTAGLTLYDRVGYLTREIEEIKELLEDYDDVKLIYEALFEYTLYLCELEGRKPNEEERGSWGWLGKLKKLDPMRNGRWEDLERKCGLEDS